MARELGAIEARPLPAGLRLVAYRPGDEEHWLAIHQNTGVYGPIGPELFEREFGDRREALPERQWFVFDGDLPIATATAWFPQEDQPVTSGRLHWVAVRPEHQRCGIASALTEQTLLRMSELGYTTAYLTTAKDNRPAIALYRSLGFEPLIRSEEEQAAWERR
jgi:ribosomal protein S18 acetylase RimI-like enzyme